jgi:pyridinium-3,5-biscarboxylic acid mononucleotide sulfurtransferase
VTDQYDVAPVVTVAAPGEPVAPALLADRLLAEVAGYGRTLVAFSGGVDSSVVLAAAVRALGPGSVAAVTAVSAALPVGELAVARALAAALGVTHYTPQTAELDIDGYRSNGPRRCYFCKSVLLDTARALASEHGFTAVTTGTNAADVAAGFRPGIRAASERGARTPLADLGLAKDSVRAVARLWGLRTWDKPAAPCLSSRIAYGVPVSADRLARIERAETAVRQRLRVSGLAVTNLRVRDLGDAARLELDADAVTCARDDPGIAAAIRASGFGNSPVDVQPFRTGSMNDLLPDPDRWRRA